MSFHVETSLNGSFVCVKIEWTNARTDETTGSGIADNIIAEPGFFGIIRIREESCGFVRIHRISEVIKEGKKIRIIFPRLRSVRNVIRPSKRRRIRNRISESDGTLDFALPPVSSLSFFVPAGTSARYLHYKYTFTEVFLVSLNSLFPRRRTSSSTGPSTAMNVLSDLFLPCITRKGCIKNFNSAEQVCHRM